MILVIKKGKQPQVLCINPKCPSKMEGYSAEQLKDIHNLESGEVERICPMCKKGKLKVRKSVYGAFIACDQYPKCRYIEKPKYQKEIKIEKKESEKESESSDEE
jgi:DNA topoisomerase-1